MTSACLELESTQGTGHVKTKAEAGVMHPQAEEYPESPEVKIGIECNLRAPGSNMVLKEP